MTSQHKTNINMHVNTIVTLQLQKRKNKNTNLKQCDFHFIDLNLRAIPLHLERVSQSVTGAINW